jgi:hypothetical protein
MSSFFPARIRMTGALLMTVLLAACGGGGTSLDGVGSGGTGIVSGVVEKGPVGSATVTAFGIVGGQVGARLGTTTTDANGNFTLPVGSYAGPLMLQASGGSYTDEATGTTMTMAPGDAMTAVMATIAAGSTNSGVHVTPVTAMAQAMASHMSGGMTDANIGAANAAMGSYFLVSDILHVQPMNPLVAGSGTGAGEDAQNYGMTLAAMSTYARTQGMSFSSAMVTAMMNDASDAVMDGKAGGSAVQMGGMTGGMMMSPIAGTSGLAAAMNAFMNSTRNKSGVTTATLMARLNGASGQILSSGAAMSSASVRGTAFNGPVSTATVKAFAVSDGAPGAQIASTTTDGQGGFTMTLGSYSGPVMLQVSGGSFTDEATGTIMTMGGSDVMSAALAMVGPGANATGIWITPLTSMAQTRAMGMTGGMTDANISAANSAMGSYFSVGDILHTQPMNPVVAGAGAAASQDANNYGVTLAAMSKLAMGLNMANSSAIVTAMMGDSFDGVMDGMHGGSPVSMAMGGMMGGGMMLRTAGTSDLASAMTSFLNSAANASGITAADMAALIQKLASSDGHI